MQISLLIQTRTRFTGGSVIMDYGILVINVLMLDLFQLLSSPDDNWWTGVVWIIVMFLSDSHSDGTHSHPLLRHWYRDTFLQTWWRNKLILISDDLRMSTFSSNFRFWMTYFNKIHPFLSIYSHRYSRSLLSWICL